MKRLYKSHENYAGADCLFHYLSRGAEKIVKMK